MKRNLVVRSATAILFLVFVCGAVSVAVLLHLFPFRLATLLAVLLALGATLAGTALVVGAFAKRISDCALASEGERRSVFEEATKQLFDNVYEVDITGNRPADDATERYFESIGVPRGTPYDKALRMIADKLVREDYRRQYLDTFAPDRVLRAYREGCGTLRCDFLMADGGKYCWSRLVARIVCLDYDGSIHMLVYHQNIDHEKKRELHMLRLAHTDKMTGLLNKGATEQQIRDRLRENPDCLHALFLFDIDNFKQANDIHGHAFGDAVIVRFAQAIRESIRKEDILGRIGGDEFAAFLPARDREWTEKKARELSDALSHRCCIGGKTWRISTSMGIAFFPTDAATYEALFEKADAALYETKARGRNGYTIYAKTAPPIDG